MKTNNYRLDRVKGDSGNVRILCIIQWFTISVNDRRLGEFISLSLDAYSCLFDILDIQSVFLFFFYFIILLSLSLSLSLNQSVVLYIADSIKKWLIHASTLANRTNPEYECERVMLHSDKREKCVSDTHSRCFTTTTTIITIYECVCASLTSRHRVIISFLPINILGHWI